MNRLVLFVVFLFSVFGARIGFGDVLVHGAASLTDALQEIAEKYQRETGQKVQFNFGSSSMLARQIQEGAPGDIFVSADELKMNDLQKRGLILTETRKSILSNTLVIIVPQDSKVVISSIQDLLKIKGNIAIAEPQSVPAGIYAKEYLKKVGLWNKVIDRLIPAENVRAALAVVEAGNAEAGIVYKTDAAISKRVRIVLEISKEEGPKISYPIAVLKESRDPQNALRFYQYLLSEKAQEIFQKYGFLITTEKTP
jgi:molybdenum ABC transporter, periplasmic molybdate-binding protein